MSDSRRPTIPGALLALGLLVCAAEGLGAQSLEAARHLASLHAGATVRVQGPAGRITARVLHVSGDALLLGTGVAHRDTATVPFAGIDTLWVRGRATKTGSVLGGLGGLVLGLLYGTAIQDVCETDCVAAIPALAIGGVTVGAVAGGVIGSAIPVWRRRYP